MTDLVSRTKGINSEDSIRHDSALADGGITVNSDPFASALDRIYDVRGLQNMHVEIINEHATNGLIYRIEKARKDYATLSDLGDADFDLIFQGNTTILSLVSATGTITLATALAGDIVTINGIDYTAVTGVKSNVTEFSIDGTDTVDAADLAASINGDFRVGTLKDVSATSALGVVTVTSDAIGTEGNSVTLAEDTGATTITVSGATLSGGVDNFDIKDYINLSPELTAIRIRVKRQTAGQNSTLAGFVSVN